MNRPWQPLLLAACLLAPGSSAVRAAVPASGTLTDLTTTLTYTSGPFAVANPTPTPVVGNGPTCDVAHPCDHYSLQISLSPAYRAAHPGYVVTITSTWPIVVSPTEADFDLWVYNSQGALMPTNAATSNDPEVAIIPDTSGTYDLTLVPFHPNGQSVTTVITVGPPPVLGYRDGRYTASADIWSKNVHLTGSGLAFSHDGDTEPAVKLGPDGTAWVVSNSGGLGLGGWKITDGCAQSFKFFDPEFPASTAGGDGDVEVAGALNVQGYYNVYTSSLDELANITQSVSMDGGVTWVQGQISDQVPVNDRQWNAAYGASTVWLSFRSLATGNNLFCYRSVANGLPGTFAGPFPVYTDVVTSAAINTQLGNMVADQRPVPGGTLPLMAGTGGEANLYHGFILGGNQVYVAVSTDFGTTWHSKLVWTGPPGTNYGQNFSWVAVDQAGNVYTAFCDQDNIYYSVSTNRGNTWTRPIRVNFGVSTKSCTMPAMAAGSAGRLVFSWYSTSATDGIHNNASDWTIMTSRTQNALDSVPDFEQVLVSDHFVHHGQVCLDGTFCACCRELLDLFEMDINPTDGSSFITYTDNGAAGGTYISKQLAGKSAISGKTIFDKSLTCPTNSPCPSCPPPPPPNSCALPGVTVLRDASGDQLGAPAANSQLDIDSVMVAEPFFVDGSKKLVFTMKVNHLEPTNLPQSADWKTYFTAPNGTQYYVDMETFDPTVGVQYHYGSVDPTLGDGDLGAAEGRLNQDGFIRVSVDPANVGGVVAGQPLTNIHMTTDLLAGVILLRTDQATTGTYTLVGNQSCGQFGLICPADRTVVGGVLYPMFFQISNSSGSAKQYQYQLTDTQGWTVSSTAALSGLTPSVPNGQLFNLGVDVQVPPGCVSGTDQYRWTAYALGNAAAAETCLTNLACGVPESPCVLPGITVVTDPANDQLSDPVGTQFDVRSTRFAEPYQASGPGKLYVTMKMANLNPLPPNGVWRTFWSVPNANGSGNDSTYYVAMSTSQTAVPSYDFGVFRVGTGGVINQTRKGSSTGSQSPDGTIQIGSPQQHAGNPAPGTVLRGVTTESRILVGTSVTGGLIEQADIGIGSNYILRGNASCALSLTCASNRTVDCGPYPMDFKFTNDTPSSATFNYSLSDSLGWITSSSAPLSGVSPTVAPGATYTLSVQSQIPNTGPKVNVLRWTVLLSGNAATTHTCATALTDTCRNLVVGVADAEVTHLQASEGLGYVSLRWDAQPAFPEARAVVLRSNTLDGEYVVVSGALSAADPEAMNFRDQNVRPGTEYFYKIGLREGGTTYFSNPIRIATRHAVFALHSVAPNPFRREALVVYELPSHTRASIDLYSVTGRRILRVFEGELEAGIHQAALHSQALPAGVYFLRLESGGQFQSRQVMLLR